MAAGVNIRIDPSLLKMDKNMRRGLVNALGMIADRVQRAAKRTKSFIDRSTHLRTQIIRLPVNVRNLTVIVRSNTKYATYVNDGTRHIKPRQYMEEGIEKTESQFERIITRELDKTM